MVFTMGPIVFVVVVFGGLGSLTGCFIASILMGLIQTFAVVFDVSLADLLAKFGFTVTSSTPFAEVLNVTLPRVGALLPFLMLLPVSSACAPEALILVIYGEKSLTLPSGISSSPTT